jgi:hypothetical protein
LASFRSGKPQWYNAYTARKPSSGLLINKCPGNLKSTLDKDMHMMIRGLVVLLFIGWGCQLETNAVGAPPDLVLAPTPVLSAEAWTQIGAMHQKGLKATFAVRINVEHGKVIGTDVLNSSGADIV